MLGRRTALASAAIAVALVAPLAPATAAPRASAFGTVAAGASVVGGVAAATSPRTTITIVFDNCAACRITRVVRAIGAGSSVRPAQPSYRSYSVRTLSGNRYRVKVPTAVTRGVTFEVDATWRGVGGYLGYVSNVALRYGGVKPGVRITKARAKAATRSYACWAGTARTSKTLHITVRKVPVASMDGSGTVNDLQAWSTRAQRTVGPSGRKLPGNQEAYYC